MLRHKSAMDDFVEFTKIDRKITLVENKISTLVVPDTRLSFFSILFEYFVPLLAAFWYYDTPVIRLENDYLYPMSYPLSIGQESTLIIGGFGWSYLCKAVTPLLLDISPIRQKSKV
eukprot:TRINITY_DN5862_c0_g1_i3.p1 TRINITY_DN5862_c0_g1~~TRINITY_DN5862_c0_g1_i3.p1  ORF type:complete len:116 (-),score=20.42 TRINITY_DN5862_c0_g1_i3:36-383(-)